MVSLNRLSTSKRKPILRSAKTEETSTEPDLQNEKRSAERLRYESFFFGIYEAPATDIVDIIEDANRLLLDERAHLV